MASETSPLLRRGGSPELRHFEVLVLGLGGSGKTTLIHHYLHGTPPQMNRTPPAIIGCIKHPEKVDPENKSAVTVTEMSTRLSGACNESCFKADGFMILYDVTNEASYREVASFLQDIRIRRPGMTNIILVGNKRDATSDANSRVRQVDFDTARKFACDNNIMIIETSAVDGYNVERAFGELLKFDEAPSFFKKICCCCV